MSLSELQNYEAVLRMQESAVNILGYDIEIFTPISGKIKVGYETREMYDIFIVKGVLNFNPKRRVFYHFNYFPEAQDSIVLAFFPIDERIKETSYVRTMDTSPVSNMLFKIAKIMDDGLFSVLRRTCFLTPIMDSTILEKLGGTNG